MFGLMWVTSPLEFQCCNDISIIRRLPRVIFGVEIRYISEINSCRLGGMISRR
jgi:hypothetical protein